MRKKAPASHRSARHLLPRSRSQHCACNIMVEDLSSHEEQPDDGAVAPEEVVDVSNTSALRDNIAKKKQNAYYYAHAHKANGPEVIYSSTLFVSSQKSIFFHSQNRSSQLMLKLIYVSSSIVRINT